MTIAGGDASLLRKVNAAASLHALYQVEAATFTELVKATGSSRVTVENAVAGLVDQGWVTEAALGETASGRPVGRPAKRYRFRAEAGCLLGLDIGVHQAVAAVTDLRGQVLGVRRTAVGPSLSPADRLTAARTLGHRTLRGAGLDAAAVKAVGVGTSGVVDSAGVVTLSGWLPDWAGTDLVAAFAEPFGAPVAAGNDARLAALAEQWRGAAAGVQDVLYIHVGRRISAGLVIGGRVHTGRHGAAGEIGVLHSTRWDTALCRLLARWADAEALFAAAHAADRQALAALDDFADDLAQGVAAMVLTMDPEMVVVGGGLSRGGSLLTGPLADRLARLCLFPIEVAASGLGDEAAALGGVRLALDAVERELFDVSPPQA
ncbi:ROK family protein [Streptomyces sp. NPDC056004]|uniref:ROK family protein n=1 Tax=Streptomyces sp. NPDC056004 TaxID=3345677 RepID=UPI0035DE5F40